MSDQVVEFQELARRVEALERPQQAASKAVAEGVLAALKEAGLTLQGRESGPEAAPLAGSEGPSAGEREHGDAAPLDIRPVLSEEERLAEGGGWACLALAGLPARALLDERSLAMLLRVTTRTVRRMVRRHELPPPVPMSGRSVWRVGKVLDWSDARADRAAGAARSRAESLGRLGLRR